MWAVYRQNWRESLQVGILTGSFVVSARTSNRSIKITRYVDLVKLDFHRYLSSFTLALVVVWKTRNPAALYGTCWFSLTFNIPLSVESTTLLYRRFNIWLNDNSWQRVGVQMCTTAKSHKIWPETSITWVLRYHNRNVGENMRITLECNAKRLGHIPRQQDWLSVL